MRPTTAALALALSAAALALGACDDGQRAEQAAARWRAQQARVDPPQLWSAQTVGEAHGGRPVLICADSVLRAGFGSVIPSSGEVLCARDTAGAAASAPPAVYRCSLGGVKYAVATATTGDLARDFEARSSITRRDGVTVYARTLRFRRVGACPAGWNVGDTTNQKGEHVSGAVAG